MSLEKALNRVRAWAEANVPEFGLRAPEDVSLEAAPKPLREFWSLCDGQEGPAVLSGFALLSYAEALEAFTNLKDVFEDPGFPFAWDEETGGLLVVDGEDVIEYDPDEDHAGWGDSGFVQFMSDYADELEAGDYGFCGFVGAVLPAEEVLKDWSPNYYVDPELERGTFEDEATDSDLEGLDIGACDLLSLGPLITTKGLIGVVRAEPKVFVWRRGTATQTALSRVVSARLSEVHLIDCALERGALMGLEGASLRELCLVGAKGVPREPASWPALPLEVLDLAYSDVSPEGVPSLLREYPSLTQLNVQGLDLDPSRLHAEGLEVIS